MPDHSKCRSTWATRGLVLALGAVLALSTTGAEGLAASPAAAVTFTATSGSPGTIIAVAGTNFPKRVSVILSWDDSTAGMPITATLSNGSFGVSMTIPLSATVGDHTLRVTARAVRMSSTLTVVAVGIPVPSMTPTPTEVAPTATPSPTPAPATPTPAPATPTRTSTPATPPSATTIASQIAASSDDAEEYAANGSMYLTSSDLELTYDPGTWPAPGQQLVGMRFTKLSIPNNATITSAYAEFTVKETTWTDPTNLTLQAEAADNSTTFTTAAYNTSSRTRTISSVLWSNLAVWNTSGAAIRTPDLSPLVQEVVNRGGWANGNALSLIVTGTGHRTPYAYDGLATGAPKLVVTFTGSDSTPAPTPSSTLSPTASPTVTPTATNGSSPSGQPMPVGDLPGWHQLFTEDFITNAPIGGFAAAYGSRWSLYLDGWPDTSGQNGTNSGYYPSKVLSVGNGVLNEFLHVENGTHMAAALLPKLPGNTSGGQGQLYGKYTVRFKADSLHDFKTAWLLWPDSDAWPRHGEIDFPEGGLDSTISAFLHHQNATSGSDQDAFNTDTTYTSWHTATTEWSPTATRFILDDRLIGTSTTRIPNTSMHYVLQTESCLGCTYNNLDGNLQIDWVVVYAPVN
jgi:hypothetical protein